MEHGCNHSHCFLFPLVGVKGNKQADFFFAKETLKRKAYWFHWAMLKPKDICTISMARTGRMKGFKLLKIGLIGHLSHTLYKLLCLCILMFVLSCSVLIIDYAWDSEKHNFDSFVCHGQIILIWLDLLHWLEKWNGWTCHQDETTTSRIKPGNTCHGKFDSCRESWTLEHAISKCKRYERERKQK